MAWNSKKPRWQGPKPRIALRQFIIINGREFDRIPYGEGDENLHFAQCDDCGALRQQNRSRSGLSSGPRYGGS